MARMRPSVRSTQTYTESNFLSIQTRLVQPGGPPIVTIEHLSYQEDGAEPQGWVCRTLVDREAMSKDDALFIAKSYAARNGVPVIYQSHADLVGRPSDEHGRD